MLDLGTRTAAFRISIAPWRNTMMQKVRATCTNGEDHLIATGPTVVSCTTCRKHTTVGCDHRLGATSPMRCGQ